MSSELERLLKKAAGRLPGPDADATRRARERAVGEVRRRRSWLSRRPRATLALATALAVTAGLGVGLGLLIAPSGSAAGGPPGLGFVPDSGWRVLQAGADATPARPALAIASNVRLSPEDDVRGVRNSSGLPYATLLTLPPRGVVIVATFTVPDDTSETADRFPVRELPLRLRDATPFVQNGVQIRPGRPLGQYELRARVNDRNVDVHLYFGVPKPSKALVTEAQSQLDRLVVQPLHSATKVEERALPLRGNTPPTAVASPSRVIDRTIVCKPGVGLGTRHITVSAQAGFRKGDTFEWLAQAVIDTPAQPLPRKDNYRPTLAAVTAGWPPKPPLTGDGMGYSASSCKSTRASVLFSRRGLAGGVASQFGEELKCFPPSTVLIRVRAVFSEPTRLTLIGKKKEIYSAIGRIEEGEIAARTPTGKPLVYAEVVDSGRARLFTARTCTSG
jgi:hypothetical protein